MQLLVNRLLQKQPLNVNVMKKPGLSSSLVIGLMLVDLVRVLLLAWEDLEKLLLI